MMIDIRQFSAIFLLVFPVEICETFSCKERASLNSSYKDTFQNPSNTGPIITTLTNPFRFSDNHEILELEDDF